MSMSKKVSINTHYTRSIGEEEIPEVTFDEEDDFEPF